MVIPSGTQQAVSILKSFILKALYHEMSNFLRLIIINRTFCTCANSFQHFLFLSC
jgi:hypothetical protein